ncbi:MAG: nucleoid-associated protein [Chlamydiae bacterium CG10_big_fil_rev_8_21_14_0_10_35_9]|nr:MAG: nucleoid-associated protein [Chlamydiae bacterium CG10_big_fil_rev_8_21_14_0_10_35_9]
MGSGFSKMKKQAKMMQDQMDKMKKEMQNLEVEGSAGGSLVKVVINGEKEVKKIVISPECVDPDDIDGLQDLIIGAFENAYQKLEQENPMPFSF